MTREEIHRDYQIPLSVIKAYDEWALSGSKTPQYSEEDLRRLSLLVTLHEAGFSAPEAQAYLRLDGEAGDTRGQRLLLLNARRKAMLEEIHRAEKRLERLDGLRFSLRNHIYETGKGMGYATSRLGKNQPDGFPRLHGLHGIWRRGTGPA